MNTKMRSRFGVLLFLVLFGLSCKTDETTSPIDSTVAVQIDLQWGFDDQKVSIKINGERSFQASIPPGAPTAGPLALYATTLPRGINQMEVSRGPIGTAFTDKDTVAFTLGNEDHYFIGLRIENDSLKIVIQTTSWGYI